jgi:hypothetical protein
MPFPAPTKRQQKEARTKPSNGRRVLNAKKKLSENPNLLRPHRKGTGAEKKSSQSIDRLGPQNSKISTQKFVERKNNLKLIFSRNQSI